MHNHHHLSLTLKNYTHFARNGGKGLNLLFTTCLKRECTTTVTSLWHLKNDQTFARSGWSGLNLLFTECLPLLELACLVSFVMTWNRTSLKETHSGCKRISTNWFAPKPDSYRTVSNLPFHFKFFEKIAFAQLSDHVESNALLPDRQSTYRKSYSTETALLILRNDMLLTANSRQGSAIVLLDLSAAFDTIDHDLLLDRINDQCGLSSSVLSWFTSYLRGRASWGRRGPQCPIANHQHPIQCPTGLGPR